MQNKDSLNPSEAQPNKRKKMALGRGLEALIPDYGLAEAPSGEYVQCDIDLIRPNRFQARLRFPQAELEQLSQSIKEQGIIQPLLLRKDNQGYELIAGERRWRAAKMAGLTQVPAVIKPATDAEMLEISIVENIQRENLNPMEEADAYHRMITELNLTQDQAALRVGKSRSAVTNFLRLRQLPPPIKASIIDGALSMGHARALLSAETSAQQNAAWQAVIAKGLSVRETEVLIKRLKSFMKKPPAGPATSEARHLKDLAENLSRHFGTKIQIKKTANRGRVEIEFYSNADLDRLIGLLQQVG
ncbi:MAG: ParB/RepB/Spo0J family partition protein [Desulfobacterales bacterium]|nr:ParB/RepB/Spo0J family partition protein [Desulfobacterales bacterium]